MVARGRAPAASRPSYLQISTRAFSKSSRSISAVAKVISAFGWGEAVEESTDPIPKSCHGSLAGGSEKRLEFGEDLLDRIEIGAVGREKQEPSSARGDRLRDAGHFVASQVVHDHEIPGPQRGSQVLFHVGTEDLPIDRSVHDQRSG